MPEVPCEGRDDTAIGLLNRRSRSSDTPTKLTSAAPGKKPATRRPSIRSWSASNPGEAFCGTRRLRAYFRMRTSARTHPAKEDEEAVRGIRDHSGGHLADHVIIETE